VTVREKASALLRRLFSWLPWRRHAWEDDLASACGPESLQRYRWYLSETTLVGGFRDPADPSLIRAPYWSITLQPGGRLRRHRGMITVDRKGCLLIRNCSFSGPHVEDERFDADQTGGLA
jgi:hypothetical protein